MIVPYFESGTAYNRFESAQVVYQRELELEEFLEIAPTDINSKYNFDNIDRDTIRLIITVEDGITERGIGPLIKWATHCMESNIYKIFRKKEGKFAYIIWNKCSDFYGSYSRAIFIENIIDENCKIITVTKKIQEFEAKSIKKHE